MSKTIDWFLSYMDWV